MAQHADPTISAVLIVKNEEDNLAHCLESVRWVDEVVVYDTGSTDHTVEIARRFTDKAIVGYWDDDFAAARNRALDHATGDWCLILDADEALSAQPGSVRARLREDATDAFSLVVRSGSADVFSMPSELTNIRLFRRVKYRYVGALHEQVTPLESVRAPLPLPNALILHSGYNRTAEALRHKGERNLELADRELAEARQRGEDEQTLTVLEVNAARSVVLAGREKEGLALGEALWTRETLTARVGELLAETMVHAAQTVGDRDLATRWVKRWEERAGNPARALATKARLHAAWNEPERALDALERIPTVVVDAHGHRTRRVDSARVEVWALASLNRRKDAVAAALRAVRAGVLPGASADLVRCLGEDGVTEVVVQLPEQQWRLLGLLCAHEADVASRRVLQIMAEARPSDPTPLICASYIMDAMTLEELAQWAVYFRRAGLAEDCPLVHASQNARLSPQSRALAGGLAYYAYRDERGLDALAIALEQVPPGDEAELLSQLEVIAPGLVTRADA